MCREVEKLVMAERSKSRAEGRLEGKIGNIRAIMENLSVSVDDAMELLKTPETDRDIIRPLIEQ